MTDLVESAEVKPRDLTDLFMTPYREPATWRERRHPWLTRPIAEDRTIHRPDLEQIGPLLFQFRSDYSAPSHRVGLPDIEIPKWFTLDGTSTPRPLWWIEPPFGPAIRNTSIHDARYFWHAPDDRLFADDELFWNCIADPWVKNAKAGILYNGVRIGGWYAWAKGSWALDRGYRPVIKTPEIAKHVLVAPAGARA